MIYLAAPYWHDSPMVRAMRAREIQDAAAQLSRRGHMVYSPVTYGRAFVEHDHDLGEEFWRAHGLEMLKRCERMYVLTLDGWQDSEGVKAELHQAEYLGLEVHRITPRHSFDFDTWVE